MTNDSVMMMSSDLSRCLSYVCVCDCMLCARVIKVCMRYFYTACVLMKVQAN